MQASYVLRSLCACTSTQGFTLGLAPVASTLAHSQWQRQSGSRYMQAWLSQVSSCSKLSPLNQHAVLGILPVTSLYLTAQGAHMLGQHTCHQHDVLYIATPEIYGAKWQFSPC